MLSIEGLQPSVASRIDWQYFVTLTFEGRVPTEGGRLRLLVAWIRQVAKAAHMKVDHLDGLAREEAGEINGRLHFHVLLSGIPGKPNIGFCHHVLAIWRKLSGSKVNDARLYDARLSGVAYVMKGLQFDGGWSASGANAYELSKYEAGKLIATPSCLRTLVRVSSNRRRRKARVGIDVAGDRSITPRGSKRNGRLHATFPHPHAPTPNKAR